MSSTRLACGGASLVCSYEHKYDLNWSETVEASDWTSMCVCKQRSNVHSASVCTFLCCVCSALPPACVCARMSVRARCQADMWFTLVLFDVSIRGLSPPTSTLLFDLHQSGPDHSAFVYFQRHFSFLLVSPTPATFPVTHSLCVCVFECVCVQVWISFVL